MIFKVPCSLVDKSLTYADFTRKYFPNMLVQDKLMGSESDFKDDCVTYDVENPTSEFIKIIKNEYPEYMVI